MNDHIELHQGDLIVLNPEIKKFLDKIRAKSRGAERRQFMAHVVSLMGKGGQRRAQDELGCARRLYSAMNPRSHNLRRQTLRWCQNDIHYDSTLSVFSYSVLIFRYYSSMPDFLRPFKIKKPPKQMPTTPQNDKSEELSIPIEKTQIINPKIIYAKSTVPLFCFSS